MPEFINKIFSELAGFDFWFAAVLFVIGLAGWYYLGLTKKTERETAKHQLRFAGLMVLVGIAGIGAHHLFFDSDYTFSKGVAGILVLQIEGDDENNSLQRLLVSSLNNSIRKEAAGQKIEIRAQNETATETMGLPQAHTKARKIGKACKAILVIWGNRVGDKTFFPRLTVVENKDRSSKSGQWALAAQDITELEFPSAQVDQPIYLKHFITGYAFYDREDYASALAQFKAVLNQSVVNPIELNEIRIYCGNSHRYLGEGQREMALHLQKAIAYYDTVLSFYTEQDFAEQWAKTQKNLGQAYADLPTGDRSVNLLKAITAFEAALRVYTENDFPEHWAYIQSSLGGVYFNLLTGDRRKHLQKAITLVEAALHVYTQKDYPMGWARLQNNLGSAYSYLPSGNRNENLQKAIAFYEAALRICTEKDFPVDWARLQNNLGSTYANLLTGEHSENLQKAIAFYEAALRVYTEKDFPVDWAKTQSNLGSTYTDLPTDDRKENLEKAIAFYEAALRVYTEKDFPEDWARTQRNLGDIYAKDLADANAFAGMLSGLLTGTRNNVNLQKAVVAYEAALRVYTEKNSPENWAATQNILGMAYMTLALTTDAPNVSIKNAIGACEAALRVYTEKDFPQNWAATQRILGWTYMTLALATDAPNAYAKKAIAACEAALRVYTKRDSVFWAGTQNILGFSYLALPSSDTNVNAKKAIAAFETALLIFTENEYPLQWAMTQLSLGGVYMELPTGFRSNDLQRAIVYFKNALKIFTAEAYPEYRDVAIEGLKGAQSQLQNLAKK